MVNELIQQGLRQHQAGRLDEAKYLYEQALEKQPRHPDALHLLGVVALQSGNAERAIALIQQAIEAQPGNPAFHANLAQACLASQRVADAHAAFRRAATLDPQDPQPAVGAANCLALQGSVAEAERELRAVAQRHPGYALAWFNLGNAVRDQGRADEAAALYRRAIQLDPGLVDAHNNLGGLLHAREKFDEAEQAYRAAIASAPGELTGYCNLASVLIDRGRFTEAEAACREALRRASGSALLHSLLGAALGHQGRLLEAIEAYRKAVEFDPGNARTLLALGSALYEVGEAAEGAEFLERAAAIDRDSSQVRHFLAGARLALGEFREGWREYAHRPARARFAKKNPGLTLATALPETLAGQHVCLAREQGLGDELFFLRFVERLKARGARVTYRANPKIAGLLARAPLLDCVLTDDEPLPAADYTLLVGDLPLALGAMETPPALSLSPLDSRRHSLAQRLAELGPPPYLGITWRAGTPPAEQGDAWALFKQVPLELLGAALCNVGGTLLALQRNPGPGEIEGFSRTLGRRMHDFSALNDDLESMVALLALIDEYIGVSNTNMHLRAGVGKTARVLVPRPAEWRWMNSGRSSPWFPGFSIYRQTLDGDWHPPLAALRQDLENTFLRRAPAG